MSPSINKVKQKESTVIHKKQETHQTDDDNASDEGNRKVVTPLKGEDPYSHLSKDSDNYYNQPKKETTPKISNNNDLFKAPISTKTFENERNRFESQLRDMENKMKKKEEQYMNEIEKLKYSHKEEIITYQEMLKTKEKEYNEEINYLRMEKNEEVKNTKESMALRHKNEIDLMEKKTERLLKEQKMKFDSENDTLKKHLEQQIEYNKLATKVELSSKHIDELMQKIQNEKEMQVSDAKVYKVSLEKLEDRLKAMENNLNRDKELFIKEKEAFEEDQLEKKKINAEEVVRIKGEVSRLEQLQSKIRSEEYAIKEKYEKEKIDLNRKYDEMKIELETMKSNYISKVNEVEYQRKMFEEEKKYFDKYKDDTLKNIDNKKYELENMKEKYYSEEKEIQSRIAIMQEKELYLTEKFEEFDKIRLSQAEKEEKIEKDRKELIIAARRIEDSIKALDEKGRLLEKEKNVLMKQYNEIESEKMNNNSEKIIIEQEKSEIRLRLQSIDMLRMKYITENRPMLNLTSPIQSIPSLTSNNFMSKTIMSTKINSKQMDNPNFYSSIPSNKTMMNMTSPKEISGGFNADKYFDSLKNRIHSNNLIDNNNDISEESNKFDKMIMKERNYLKKSTESLESNTKNEYEKMKKNHFDSINITNLNIHEGPSLQQFKDKSFDNQKKDSTLDNYEEIQNE